eukprot:4376525-Amphidinium_carterae.2
MLVKIARRKCLRQCCKSLGGTHKLEGKQRKPFDSIIFLAPSNVSELEWKGRNCQPLQRQSDRARDHPAKLENARAGSIGAGHGLDTPQRCT